MRSEILEWKVPEGARVSRGSVLVEIETDKAASELESVAEGVLLKRCVAEGVSVKAGDIIAWVGAPGETIAEPPLHRARGREPGRKTGCRSLVCKRDGRIRKDHTGRRAQGQP